MDNTNVTPAVQSAAECIGILDSARSAVVDAVSKTGTVIQGYADALTMVFGNGWWLLVGKEKRPLKVERERFVTAMMERGVQKASTDVYWQRVKMAAGYEPNGRKSAPTDVDAKTAAELKTMIGRILTAEEKSEPKASEIKGMLMDAFEILTGDKYTAK